MEVLAIYKDEFLDDRIVVAHNYSFAISYLADLKNLIPEFNKKSAI